MQKQSDKNHTELLSSWLSSLNFNDEKEPTLKGIHIGELIGKQDNQTYFFKSLEMFYDLIHTDFNCNFRINYIPSLIFSLGWSNQISLQVRNDTLWEELSDDTPPNIYLTPKTSFFIREEVEEYIVPLYLEPFEKLRDSCLIYYRCFRTLDYIQSDREYYRLICIENLGHEACDQARWRLLKQQF